LNLQRPFQGRFRTRSVVLDDFFPFRFEATGGEEADCGRFGGDSSKRDNPAAAPGVDVDPFCGEASESLDFYAAALAEGNRLESLPLQPFEFRAVAGALRVDAERNGPGFPLRPVGAPVALPRLVDQVIAGMGQFMQQGFPLLLRRLPELQTDAAGLAGAGDIAAEAAQGIARADRQREQPVEQAPALPLREQTGQSRLELVQNSQARSETFDGFGRMVRHFFRSLRFES